MNCAGLSREFLETELFGHEKGAYTGAVSSKPGLLEVAHRGVVFLDEIGDLDPQVQPKLLKVLEEKRFRRLGRGARPAGRRPAHRRHAPEPAPARPGEEVPQRPLLPHQHHPAARAGAARAAGGHPDPRPPAPRRLLAATSGGAACGSSAGGRARAVRRTPGPGNVRELRNVLERALLLCGRDVLEAGDLRFEGPGRPCRRRRRRPPGAPLTLEELERQPHRAASSRSLGGRVAEASPAPRASPEARSTRRSRSSGSPSPAPPEAVPDLEPSVRSLDARPGAPTAALRRQAPLDQGLPGRRRLSDGPGRALARILL